MIKLECGDCIKLMKEIPSKSIDCILTDPPYLYLKNQEFDKPFDEKFFFNEINRIIKDSGFIVLFGRGSSFYRWNTILNNLGFEFKEEIIWNKRQTSNLVGAITRVHETISIHSKKGKLNLVKLPYIESKMNDLQSLINDINRLKSALNNPKSLQNIEKYIDKKLIEYNKQNVTKHSITTSITKSYDRAVRVYKAFDEGLKPKSIIECNREHFKLLHPCQKPVALLEILLKITSNDGDLILDPFMGSGSAGIACINTNRNFIGFEINNNYFEIAKNRIGG